MNKQILSPFDCDMCAMIEDITGNPVEVKATPDIIRVGWVQNGTVGEQQRIEALKQAIRGRLGDRFDSFEHCGVFFKYDPEQYPEELRTRLASFDPKAGTRYCRTLKEINAIQVRRDNVDELLKFTGGGTMTTPRTPDGIAVYSFPNQNGLYIDVTETWYIIREDNGEFTTRNKRDFDAEFEPKGCHVVGNYEQTVNPVIKEALELMDNAEKNKKLIPDVWELLKDFSAELFDKQFGTTIISRFNKLNEEYAELMEAWKNYQQSDFETHEKALEQLVDELADVNAVVFHIATILGYDSATLLYYAADKVQGRIENPEYKREKEEGKK